MQGICGPFSGDSTSYRSRHRIESRKVTKETVMYNIALIQTLNSDWDFHTKPSLASNEDVMTNVDNQKESTRSPDDLKTKMKTFKKLGLKVVQDRTLCFAGRVLRGVLMPNNRFLQSIIMRRIFLWYFSCIRVIKDVYRVNNRCFVEKEKKFIKMMRRISANVWLKTKTMKLFYFQ